MRCISPINLTPASNRPMWKPEKPQQKILVPCGKCIPCLSNKRQDWVFRLQQENKVSQSSLFVTLTYHPKYCPDGLVKKHLQLFMKRLRKRDVNQRLRYFAVGEYGTKRKRPHYHILLFNCSDEKYIRQAWCNKKGEPFGIVHVGKVTPASIAYCTKYIIQPEQKDTTQQKPFTLMSRRYGLGANYLTDEMVNWHVTGRRNFAMVYGQKVRLPRYYRDKIWPLLKTGDPDVIRWWNQERERVSHQAKWIATKAMRKELRYFRKKYGRDAKRKRLEFRNAHLLRIKQKVSYTENL